jgi:hypothetical protein
VVLITFKVTKTKCAEAYLLHISDHSVDMPTLTEHGKRICICAGARTHRHTHTHTQGKNKMNMVKRE